MLGQGLAFRSRLRSLSGQQALGCGFELGMRGLFLFQFKLQLFELDDDLLARMRCGNPNSGPVFSATNGKPLSLNKRTGRVILPALRKAGLESLWHGWHSARRALGSNLYALGVQEKTIQVILRHANVSSTSSYYIKTAPSD